MHLSGGHAGLPALIVLEILLRHHRQLLHHLPFSIITISAIIIIIITIIVITIVLSSSSSSSSLGQSRLSGIVGPGNSSSGYILECSQHLQQNSRLKTIESNDQYEPIIKDQLKGTIHNNS